MMALADTSQQVPPDEEMCIDVQAYILPTLQVHTWFYCNKRPEAGTMYNTSNTQSKGASFQLCRSLNTLKRHYVIKLIKL